jgi:hypothetical protein
MASSRVTFAPTAGNGPAYSSTSASTLRASRDATDRARSRAASSLARISAVTARTPTAASTNAGTSTNQIGGTRDFVTRGIVARTAAARERDVVRNS